MKKLGGYRWVTFFSEKYGKTFNPGKLGWGSEIQITENEMYSEIVEHGYHMNWIIISCKDESHLSNFRKDVF